MADSTHDSAATATTFILGHRHVPRLGYGAMQLAGKGVFGPPRDRDAVLAVLRDAVEAGVDHIDTSDFYGPHITNRSIREAPRPCHEDIVYRHATAIIPTRKNTEPRAESRAGAQARNETFNPGTGALDLEEMERLSPTRPCGGQDGLPQKTG